MSKVEIKNIKNKEMNQILTQMSHKSHMAESEKNLKLKNFKV